jgi:hypothetical protein
MSVMTQWARRTGPTAPPQTGRTVFHPETARLQIRAEVTTISRAKRRAARSPKRTAQISVRLFAAAMEVSRTVLEQRHDAQKSTT